MAETRETEKRETERRDSVRFPVSIRLSVSDLYRQDYSGIHNLDTPIEVENISKSGLCFVTEGIFPIGYYFDAALAFDGNEQKNAIFTTVKIVRSTAIDPTHYRYGCHFTTTPEHIEDFLTY